MSDVYMEEHIEILNICTQNLMQTFHLYIKIKITQFR